MKIRTNKKNCKNCFTFLRLFNFLSFAAAASVFSDTFVGDVVSFVGRFVVVVVDAVDAVVFGGC
jgi:hypothetical protein